MVKYVKGSFGGKFKTYDVVADWLGNEPLNSVQFDKYRDAVRYAKTILINDRGIKYQGDPALYIVTHYWETDEDGNVNEYSWQYDGVGYNDADYSDFYIEKDMWRV